MLTKPLEIGKTYKTRDGGTAVPERFSAWSTEGHGSSTGGAYINYSNGKNKFVYKDGSFVGRADSLTDRPYDLVEDISLSPLQLDLFD